MINDLHVFSMYSPAAGSARVRIYDWLRYLGQPAEHHQYLGMPTAGPRTMLAQRKNVAAAERSLRLFDPTGRTVLMSREASPLSSGGVEKRLLKQAAHAVYDFDDALFHDNSLKRTLFGGSAKFAKAVAAADTVIAGNDYLAEWAVKFNKSITVIPSCVNPDDYQPAREPNPEHPVLVWLGSRSTERYLLPIIPALIELHRGQGVRLKLISAPGDNPDLAALSPMLDRVPWSAKTFASELADADLALAPLDDTPYARGKCAYKILQYAATGLPIVGSPVGANSAALARLGGVSVERPGEWTDAILSSLSAAQSNSGIAAHERRSAVADLYSFRAWGNRWTEVVSGAPSVGDAEQD